MRTLASKTAWCDDISLLVMLRTEFTQRNISRPLCDGGFHNRCVNHGSKADSALA